MALTKKREAMALTGYGASEVGVIAGLSRWSTPVKIYEKRVHGLEHEDSLPAELGVLLEEPLAKKYAADTGVFLAKSDTLRHRVQTFALAIATPDRIAFAEKRSTRAHIHGVEECEGAIRNVQIKTASMFDRGAWGIDGTDVIPETYLAQVQWEMAVTGLRETHVPVLFDKAEFSVFRIEYDEQIFLALYEMVEKFHVDHVLARVPPPVDGSDDYRDFLFRRFSTAGKAMLAIEPATDAEAQILRLHDLKAMKKQIEGEIDVVDNAIRGAIGEAGGLKGAWGELKWLRAPGKSSPDWEAIAKAGIAPEALSALVAQHQKTRAPYDQLRATWNDAFFNNNTTTNSKE